MNWYAPCHLTRAPKTWIFCAFEDFLPDAVAMRQVLGVQLFSDLQSNPLSVHAQTLRLTACGTFIFANPELAKECRVCHQTV
jgi:hypothetical protein